MQLSTTIIHGANFGPDDDKTGLFSYIATDKGIVKDTCLNTGE